MPVKIDPLIVEELAALDLVIWEAKHPRESFYNTKTMKESTREDKSWVLVTLAGPGVEECRGGRRTLREAVDAAITHSPVVYRVPGLRGSFLRLERAMFDLTLKMAEQRYDRELDDDIPF
jgi:hypothetical protein